MDKILFSRFARSVHAEIGNDEVDIAQNYEELIRQISSMTYYFPADMVQEKGGGKKIKQYEVIFVFKRNNIILCFLYNFFV